jgi:hypothetical protein
MGTRRDLSTLSVGSVAALRRAAREWRDDAEREKVREMDKER